MKNKAFEWKCKSAKEYAKKWAMKRPLTTRGNFIPYSHDEPKRFGWWDDVFFRFGSQVIAVWWTHPRLKYEEACGDIAYDQVDELYPPRIIKPITPIFKRVGKNRKKAVAICFDETPKEQYERFEAWKRIKENLLATSDIAIRPYIEIGQLSWCRGVSICLPIEVVDQQSLEDLADIVRAIMSGEKRFEDFYPAGYVYGRNEWAADQAKMKEFED